MTDLEQLLERISINTHSSIRVEADGRVIYADPFRLNNEPHDADLIFITHDHFDHFSPEDALKAAKEDTVFVVPETIVKSVKKTAKKRPVLTVAPGDSGEACGVRFEAVPAYNPDKPFHPRKNNWVGYVIEAEGFRIYIAGDTDATAEAASVRCDVAMLPVGGKYTMDPLQAAELANRIRPQAVIPTHYGSVAGSQDCFEQFARAVDPAIPVCRKVPRSEP